jgi:hypothetical protein
MFGYPERFIDVPGAEPESDGHAPVQAPSSTTTVTKPAPAS